MSNVKTATSSIGGGDYAAHMDLHTLIEAEKIKKDGKRHKAAMKHHKKMLSEHEKHGAAIAAVKNPKGPRVSEGPKSPKRDDHDGDEGGY